MFVSVYINMSVFECTWISGCMSKDKRGLLSECICVGMSRMSVCVRITRTIIVCLSWMFLCDFACLHVPHEHLCAFLYVSVHLCMQTHLCICVSVNTNIILLSKYLWGTCSVLDCVLSAKDTV